MPSVPTTDSASVRRITVRALYFEGQLDLKRFRAHCPHYPVLAADPLIVEPTRGSYAVLTKFGTVVLWDCTEQATLEVLKEIQALPDSGERHPDLDDRLEVVVGQPENRVTFNEVWVRELTVEMVNIISLALGQSVALERFEHEVMAAMRRFEPVITELRDNGHLALSEHETLRAVGLALGVRSAVLANLTLFDAPPETWESEALSRLDSQLYDLFDLEERLSAINQKVEFLNDLNGILMDLIAHRKSLRLEWVVIILIALEIVFFAWVELR